MKCRFYLYKRKDIFYCQLKNPKTGKKLTARSTGTSNRAKAEYIAQKWLYEGIPDSETSSPRTINELATIDDILSRLKTTPLTDQDVKKFITYFKSEGLLSDVKLQSKNVESFISFLQRIWDYENSPYVQEKLAHGQSITRNHVKDMLSRVVRYWEPYFKDVPLTAISRKDLQAFSLDLSKQSKVSQKGEPLNSPLAPQTINNILKAGFVPLKWAYDSEIIPNNPAANIRKFSGKNKKRGILTDQEVEKLFTFGDWGNNKAARLGNLLSCQTGMRAGEIVALQIRDVLDDRLKVKHSFSRVDGLKTTKNGEERLIPLLPETREMLINYAKTNPHGVQSESFIFYQAERGNAPMRPETLLSRLVRALESIGIDKETKKKRGLCFHSWRHYYARKMTDALDMRAAKLTGHKTASMLEHYANHADENDFKKAAEATNEVFGKILPFVNKKAE